MIARICMLCERIGSLNYVHQLQRQHERNERLTGANCITARVLTGIESVYHHSRGQTIRIRPAPPRPHSVPFSQR